MACLSFEQIEFIKKDLRERSLSRSFLFNEYVDHICCDVENLMNKGKNFEDAYSIILKSIGEKEMINAHSETLHLLSHKYIVVKYILYLGVFLFGLSWLIDLKGAANWTGLVSFIMLSIVYLKLGIDFIRERRWNKLNSFLAILSLFAFLGTLSGTTLIFLNRNFGIDTRGHSVDLTVFGWFFFSLLCLLYYINEQRTSIETGSRKKNNILSWISGIILFLALVTIATFPLYKWVSGYIFYLILVVLGFDVMVLFFLIIRKHLKNILIVTLVLGSFMIIFIHSPFRQRLPGGKPKTYSISVKIKPEMPVEKEKVYFYICYDKFREHKFTIPMRKDSDGTYTNVWPSYTYKGYLIYTIRWDSLDANQVFIESYMKQDSIYLNIPKKLSYEITLNLSE